MKLLDYLISEGLDFSSGARRLTERFPNHPISPKQMREWCLPIGHTEQSYPRGYRYRDLYVWSAGAVTPNDFYDLPDLGLLTPPSAGVQSTTGAGHDGPAPDGGGRPAAAAPHPAAPSRPAASPSLTKVNGHGGDE